MVDRGGGGAGLVVWRRRAVACGGEWRRAAACGGTVRGDGPSEYEYPLFSISTFQPASHKLFKFRARRRYPSSLDTSSSRLAGRSSFAAS